ncbi:MAG: hypothetical protein K0Q56_527 [Sporolactobacillus laevolacticus]|jgi:8-oxo-dGTP pyrophosphatase MutT (NUDIX family)|nr:hypothetical protein [Sporolactobacillus laevolacticus]
MGYIEELRSLVGHRPLILVGSVVLICDNQGRVLMQKRKFPKGYWGLPGGLMELGESAEDTAVREVFEETGLTINQLKLFRVYSGMKKMSVAENGDQYYPVTISYVTKTYNGEWAIDPAESETFEFRSRDNLPEHILRNHKRILNDFLSIQSF